MREVICYTCNRKGHFSRDCLQHRWARPQNQQWTRPPQTRPPIPSTSRVVDTDYYEAEEPIQSARANVTPQERANQWLANVAVDDDEVKDLVLQELTRQEGFRDA